MGRVLDRFGFKRAVGFQTGWWVAGRGDPFAS